MKKILIVVVCIVAVLLSLLVAKDFIIKTSVEKGVQMVTGLRLNTGSFNVGIVNTLVGIKDLRLFNPIGYKDEVMLDMPEIYVDYDLPAIIGGKIHLEEIRIDLKQFTVVKNEKGELNLDSLKVVKEQKEGAKPVAKEKSDLPEMQIDTLRLKIGKVVYKDYSRGAKPAVSEYKLNLDEEYKNITDPKALVSLIVVKALMNTTIARLTDFDLGGLQGTLSDSLTSAQELATKAAAKAQEAAMDAAKIAQESTQQATQKTQEVVGETTEALKGAAEGLTNMIKLPFGSKEE